MSNRALTLLISDKSDLERDAVAEIWEEKFGDVLRLARFWEPPELNSASVRIYGAETFSLVLAQILNVNLVTPTDDLILSVPDSFLLRKVRRAPLAATGELKFPIFVKSLIPKQFEARIYQSRADLADVCAGLDESSELLVSEIVSFIGEARFFVRNNTIASCALYEGVGDLESAKTFVKSLIRSMDLPVTFVVDVGLLADENWCVVEFNAAWGAGLNGCDPQGVAECIAISVC